MDSPRTSPRPRRRAVWTFASLTCLVAASAAALNLESAAFRWDISDSDGSIGDGTDDAYDGCYSLSVGGTRFSSTAEAPALGGREARLGPVDIAGLQVRRRIYVPSDRDYARFVEVLTNPGERPITTMVTIQGNLGSDSGTMLSGTSTGATLVSSAVAWFATSDGGDFDPPLAHIFQSGPGTGATVAASSASLSGDNLSWTFPVTVPPRETVAILTFAVQAADVAASLAEARRLVALPDDAWTGMLDVETAVLNFPARTILASCVGARVGARCDDGMFCTERDACTAAGTCVGTARTCDDANACTLDSCDESADRCENMLTADNCSIGGGCVASGGVHPAYPCLVCDPARSRTDWSPRMVGTACASASCVAGRIVGAGTCDAAGTCTRAATVPCMSGLCADATMCAGGCMEVACPGDSYCAPSGRCELRRALGSACADGAICASGHCTDGVCCDTACEGSCTSCNGAMPGRCGPVMDGQPDDLCPAGCDGAGACRMPDAGPLDAAIEADGGGLDGGSVDASADVTFTLDAAIAPRERPGCQCGVGSRTVPWGAAWFALVALPLSRRRRSVRG